MGIPSLRFFFSFRVYWDIIDISQHCTSLGCKAYWLIYKYEMMTTVSLMTSIISYRYKMKEIKIYIFPYDENSRFTFNFHIKHTAVLIILISVERPSVQFSRSVVSNSLQPHESRHARPPCLSPTPGVYSNSHPSSQWCHPAISSSVVPFSSCPQSLPASESFPVSQLFTSKVLEFHPQYQSPQLTPRSDLL